MVSNGVMKRRKRAQIGTLLAILLILVPLPVGSLIVGNMNDFGVQQEIFYIDDIPNDVIFGAALVDYDNASDEYTYSKYLEDGETLLSNYTSDVAKLKFGYRNTSGSAHTSLLSWSGVDDGVFFIITQSTEDTDADFTLGATDGESDYNPAISLISVVSPGELLDNDINSVDVFFENSQDLDNVSVIVGVYDDDNIPDLQSGLRGVYHDGVDDSYNNYEIAHVVNQSISSNGTTISIPISATTLLTQSTLHNDGYVFVAVVDKDLNQIDVTYGVTMGVTFIGPQKAYSLTSTWNMCLIATGLIGMFGAVLATPFVSLESFSNDGQQGRKYKHGYVGKKQNSNQRRRS